MLILVVMASVSGQAIVVGDGLAGMSLKGGREELELAKLLCENSGADVEVVVGQVESGSVFGCTPWWSFSTHHGKERLPDMTLLCFDSGG